VQRLCRFPELGDRITEVVNHQMGVDSLGHSDIGVTEQAANSLDRDLGLQ
jgi:hypothetical protein